ncbi:MAG: phosphoheptose isomerase [Elusimicrobia bacterium GWA2_56_46]|nr:MAG: phosphoheptose isomerase [Elusimicrobia bacterium GWA2_56_46]OGR55264.1 MAG: phosphoheptose isomerase [Elusimicrobia bacterium GWC2_56_31]HBB66928.1 phosphoheptose isomerase [Elusimicrobiota bacterium]HBW22773.1 D-sedoheptulose 7-phosphate isomerase [Elusimicrobiota bacterium]
MEEKIRSAIESHIACAGVLSSQWGLIGQIASAIGGAVRKGGKVLICGNGGSAADSQHIAAELVGRFRKERRAVAALALTTDTSILTALGNDYGFDKVFSRQVEAHGRNGDVLIAISTSGSSPDVLNAVNRARETGMTTIGLLGRDGGTIKPVCDLALVIKDDDTARIQEMHILAAHIICGLVEDSLALK